MKGQIFSNYKPSPILGRPFEQPKKKKSRAKLTPAQRIKIWEHPEIYGRKCSICGHRITKLSDLQLDHTRAYSKGGTKLNLAHADCNKIKGSKSLSCVQKKMGFKTIKRKSTKRAKKKVRQYPLVPAFKPLKFTKIKFKSFY